MLYGGGSNKIPGRKHEQQRPCSCSCFQTIQEGFVSLRHHPRHPRNPFIFYFVVCVCDDNNSESEINCGRFNEDDLFLKYLCLSLEEGFHTPTGNDTQ